MSQVTIHNHLCLLFLVDSSQDGTKHIIVPLENHMQQYSRTHHNRLFNHPQSFPHYC